MHFLPMFSDCYHHSCQLLNPMHMTMKCLFSLVATANGLPTTAFMHLFFVWSLFTMNALICVNKISFSTTTNWTDKLTISNMKRFFTWFIYAAMVHHFCCHDNEWGKNLCLSTTFTSYQKEKKIIVELQPFMYTIKINSETICGI